MIRSMKEFNEKYFPKATETERIENMSPKELGEYLAKKSLEELKKKLRNKND